MLSLPMLVCGFAILLCSYLIAVPLLWYFKDPLKLRRYPAPSLLAAITPLWLIRATWSQKRSKLIHAEFQQHGDVLRVSPDHLVFQDPAAIKDIYGVLANSRGVTKDSFYDRVAGNAHDLVQLRDRGEHSARRKALANAFAAKTVVNMEDVIASAGNQLLQRLDASVGMPINLRLWLNYFTLDVIGDTGFGSSMGFLQTMSDTARAETYAGQRYCVSNTIDSLHRGVRYSLTMGNIPSLRLGRWLKSNVTSLSPLAHRIGKTSGDDFENICMNKLRQRIADGTPTRSSGDFMNFVLKDKQRVGIEGSYSTEQFHSLVADSVMMMNAGSDTTAAALTSTLWFLMRNPSALAKLRAELVTLAPYQLDNGKVFSYDAVKDLPYLRACIDESLRLRPPIAYQLPRLVSKPVNIAGYDILPGTVVAVAPWSVHRHPRYFPQPDDYRPERWVDFDEQFPEQREHLKQFNIVFSQGSRACIGRHLAIVELQMLVSTLVMRYDILLVEPDKELEIFERFNSNPGPMFVTVTRREA